MSEAAGGKGAKGIKEIKTRRKPALTKEDAIAQGLELMDRLSFCLLGTNGEESYPNIKAMNNLKHEGLKKIWFSTNTSSKRVRQLKSDNRASVYFVDARHFKGLMLTGTIEILQDNASKKMLWTNGDEKFYPLGVEDPDYSVLCFTAEKGNYYHALQNITFEIG